MVRFFNVTVLLLFWQFGKITHSLLPLVVTRGHGRRPSCIEGPLSLRLRSRSPNDTGCIGLGQRHITLFYGTEDVRNEFIEGRDIIRPGDVFVVFHALASLVVRRVRDEINKVPDTVTYQALPITKIPL